MTTNPSGGFEDGFLELVEEQLLQLRQNLSDIDQQILRLQEQRADAAHGITQLEALLRHNPPSREEPDVEPSPSSLSPQGTLADADKVAALIRDHRESVHYEDRDSTSMRPGDTSGPSKKRRTHTRLSDPEVNVDSRESFEFRFVGLKARAIYLGNGNMMVLRGSQARNTTTALGNGAAKTLAYRARLLRDGSFADNSTHYVLTRDIQFDSPSLAAKVMSGRAANGWVEWKTVDGLTLSDVYRE